MDDDHVKVMMEIIKAELARQAEGHLALVTYHDLGDTMGVDGEINIKELAEAIVGELE